MTKFRTIILGGAAGLAVAVASLVASLAWAPTAAAQTLPSQRLGGSSSLFGSRVLPSSRLGQGLSNYGGITNASQFSRAGGQEPLGPLAARLSVDMTRFSGGLGGPAKFAFGGRNPDAASVRLRSLESYALSRRARFANLQKGSLELSQMIGGEQGGQRADFSQTFFQFIFPFGLLDKSAQIGYGYFCTGCLQRGLIADPESYLADFTTETQQSIAEPGFLAAIAAMFKDGHLPAGQELASYYDSQLAAMGNYLFSNRRYAAAAEVWDVLAGRDTTSSLFAQALGQSLFAAGKFEPAAAALRDSLLRVPGWGGAGFKITGANLQNIYADPADLAAARKGLEAALAKDPADPRLAFLMAYIDLFHGLWDRAEPRLATLSQAGDDISTQLLAALQSGRVSPEVARPFLAGSALTIDELVRLGSKTDMQPGQRKALAESIMTPMAYKDFMTRGDYYFFMGIYAKASEAFAEAIKLEPRNAVPRFAVAHAAFANAEYEYAALRLKEGLTLEPNWGLFNFRLEEFFGDRLELDRRIVDLEHLLQLGSDDNDKLLLLGYVYYFDGRYEEAARLLARIVPSSLDFQKADYLLKLARLQS